MEIKLVNNKEEWNNALFKLTARPCFLQSYEWGEVLQSTGQLVERLLVINNNKPVAAAQVVYKKIFSKWRYAFSAKGPVFDNNEIFEVLKKYFVNKNCIFYKIEPMVTDVKFNLIAKEVTDIDPPTTLLLDLTKTEEELFAQMRQKTRYNIRLAEKKGLIVSEKKNFMIFWQMFKITAKRDGFFLLPESTYKRVLESPLVFMRTVYYNNIPLAIGCYIGFGGSMYYLYGASNNEYRQYMGSYLLQWTAIKTAKQLGYRYFDWFGVAPRRHDSRYTYHDTFANDMRKNDEYMYDPKHRYAGITRFKLGFGGEVKEDPGTYDLIFYPFKYRVYKILQKLKRLF